MKKTLLRQRLYNRSSKSPDISLGSALAWLKFFRQILLQASCQQGQNTDHCSSASSSDIDLAHASEFVVLSKPLVNIAKCVHCNVCITRHEV